MSYFTVQLCLHIVINFLWPPEPIKMCHICPLTTDWAKVCEILRKHRISVEMGKFCSSSQNSTFRRKLWCVVIVSQFICLPQYPTLCCRTFASVYFVDLQLNQFTSHVRGVPKNPGILITAISFLILE